MDKTVIVGFGYRARSGKDEAIKAILEARGGQYDVRVYGFGDAVKQEVNAAAEAAGGMLELFKQGGILEELGPSNDGGKWHAFPDWVQYDPDADMTDPLCPLGKQRSLLQWWGTEYRRGQDPNYWVDKLRTTLEDEQPHIALIRDLRFPNEVSWVKSDPTSGFTVRVDRLGFDNGLKHASEHMLDFLGEEDWHYIIQVPDGELDELRRDAVVVFDLVVQFLTPPDLSDIEHFEERVLQPSEVVQQ